MKKNITNPYLLQLLKFTIVGNLKKNIYEKLDDDAFLKSKSEQELVKIL